MKAFKFIIFLLLIIIIGACTYVAVQPNNYEVVRTRTIDAPAAVIYDNVIDFKNWNTWSSWIEKNPETKVTYPEKTDGVGGSYSWEDDDGIGRMETVAASAPNSIEQSMRFDDFEPSTVNWNFETIEDSKTSVSWSMKSDKVSFWLKLFGVMSGGFDNMIGPDFERGLEKLDSVIVESTKKYEVTINGITEYSGGFYLYKTTSATSQNISQMMGKQFGEIMQFMIPNNIQPTGMPFTIYLNDMAKQENNVIMSQAMPIATKIETPADSNIICDYMPRTKVLKTILKGNYTNLSKAWETTMKYIEDNNLVRSEIHPFEVYTNDPGDFPNPADWITEIFIPLKE